MGDTTQVVKVIVRRDGEYYTAEGVELDVFTQGRTLDETVDNIRKTVAVHLEGEDPNALGLAPDPSILVMLEVDIPRAS